MLRLTATWADAWNTAWYAEPNDKFQALRSRSSSERSRMPDAPGRCPAHVGNLVGGDPADAIARKLHTWAELGVDDVIAEVEPITPESVERLGSGVRVFRGA
jgi:hypothetical protein